jgi:hypothetical protein
VVAGRVVAVGVCVGWSRRGGRKGGVRVVRLTDSGLGGHVQVFHKRMPPEAVDLVSRLLQYSPNLRCNAVSGESVGGVFFGGAVAEAVVWWGGVGGVWDGSDMVWAFVGCVQLEACVHPFFDELRDPNCRLPNGRPLPPLFNFKPQGGAASHGAHVVVVVV